MNLAELFVKLALDSSDYARGLSDSAQKTAQWASDVSKKTSEAGGAFGNMLGPIGKLTGALGGVATVAAGMIAANIFGNLASGVGNFVSSGLEAVSTAQQLEMSMQALLAQNNMYERSVQQVTTSTTKELMTQDEYIQKQAELTASINLQKASIQEQIEHIRQTEAAWGSAGLETIQQKARLEKMQVALRGTEQDLAGLAQTSTEYGTATKITYNQINDLTTAQRLAASQSKELLGFVEKLAVVSPFEQEQVAQVTKFAIGAGLAVEEAKSFTSGFLDLSAAVGIGSDSLGFAADQLLQVAKVGQLTTMDLRQLRRLGIDLEKIIGVEMGMSIEEFNAKASESPEIFNDLFNSVAKFSKNTFGGTVERMAGSLGGMKSTLKDLFTVGSKKLLEPLVNAVSPAASRMISQLSDFILGGNGLASIGQKAADYFAAGLSKAGAIARAFGRSADEGFRMVAYFAGKAWPGIEAQLAVWGQNFWNWLTLVALPAGQTALAAVTSWLSEQLAAYWPVIQATLTQWGTDFWGWITGSVIPQIPTVLSQVTTGIITFLTEEWPKIKDSLASGAGGFWDWLNTTVIPAIGPAFAGVIAGIVAWASAPETQAQINTIGATVGQNMASGIAAFFANIDNVALVVSNIVTGLAIGIAAVAGTLIALGGQLLASIVAGMAEYAGAEMKPWTLNQLREFYGWFYSVNWAEVGHGLMSRIGEGLAEAAGMISQSFSTGVASWKKIITEAKWGELGKSIVTGLVKGINDNVAKVYEVLKGMAKQAIAEAGAAIGFGSPAKEFIPLGASIPQGLAVGLSQGGAEFQNAFDKMFNINRGMASVNGAIGSARDYVEKWLDKTDLSSGKVSAILSELSQVFRANSTEILTATNRVKAFKEAAKKMGLVGAGLTGGGEQGKIVERAFGQFLSWYDKILPQLQAKLEAQIIAGARSAIGMVGKLGDMAKSAIDMVNQDVDSLYQMLQTGADMLNWNGQILSNAQAQELYNKKLEEQLAAQQQIAELQRSEKQLDFLTKQLDLIEQAKKSGVNLADVFGGLQFGTDAPLASLVEASNRIIQSMIGQISTDLSSISPGLPALSALSGGSGGVTNNTFNQTINSSTGVYNALGQYQQARAVMGT